MVIDEHTGICISIAEKKGNFGLKFHNKGYSLLNLNYAYIPLKVLPDDLSTTLQLVRDNFHGCSVSMPHKIKVMEYLDELDESSEKAGAVNTILKIEKSRLRGYNTDYYGALTAIKDTLGSIKDKPVLMLGAGGVARAIGHAVKDLEGRLSLSNRTEDTGRCLAESLGVDYVSWDNLNDKKAHLLIDATSVGMGTKEMVVSERILSNFDAVMDVVVSSETELLRVARSLGKTVIPGTLMTTYQGAKQFEIYTGERLPADFIIQFREEFENGN